VQQQAASARIERLSDLIAVIRRRWLLVAAITLLVTGAALTVALRATPEYDSSARLLLTGSDPATALLTGQSSGGSSDPERDVNTVVDLTTNDPIAEAVQRRLALPYSVPQLLQKVDAAVESNSNIISITARDAEPARASQIANAFADEYVRANRREARERTERSAELAQAKFDSMTRRERRSEVGRELRARVQELELAASLQTGGVRVVREAPVPTSAASVGPVRVGALAAVLGFVLGVAAAVVLHLTDKRLRGEQEAQDLFDVPVLAGVPPAARRRLARRPGDDEGQHEAYMTLATNLRFFDVNAPQKAILVTSPGPEEGKTSVALGLARAMALLGQRVVVIEADLRRPAFAGFLGVPEAPKRVGTSALGARVVHVDAETMRPVERPFDPEAPIFTAALAHAFPNPQALLASEQMAEMIASATEASDVVVIDTAPVGTVNDAITLSRLVDGILLVARLNRTRKDTALKSLDLLRHVTTPLVGVVLTGTERTTQGYEAAPWRRVVAVRAAEAPRVGAPDS
jgi:capsular exopolysaccharide synthesis family protein